MVRCIFAVFIMVMLCGSVALASWGDDTFTEADILELIQALSDENEYERRGAAEDLGRAGEAAAVAIPELIQALYDESEDVRDAARDALACIGDASVPYLLGVADDANASVSIAAVEALVYIGADTGVIPILRDMFKSADMEVRRSAIKASGRLRNGGSELIHDLIQLMFSDDEPYMRGEAATALGLVGRKSDDAIDALIDAFDKHILGVDLVHVLAGIGPNAVPHLIDASRNGEPKTRRLSIRALGDIGPNAADAIPRLIEALKDPLLETRSAAAYALGKIGPLTPEVIPALMKAAETGSDEVRCGAIWSLSLFGPDAVDAVDVALEALEDSSPSVVANAATALGWLKADDPEIIAALLKVVDRFADVENPVGWDPRGAAITAFGDIGYPAKEAIPLLIDIIREGKDNGEIVNAVTALGKIDIHDPGVIEALAEAYGHEYSGTRKAVSNAIANHAAELKGYIPIIADMLRSRNFDVSLYIIAALGDIGPEALPLLIEGLRMVKPDVRTYYISAIGKLGPAATKAIPDLIKSLDGDGKNEATSAASALGAIGPDAAEAVPALIAKLSSENQSLRDRVAVALGNIGPCARDAVPILIELARNEEINIADAIKALATIGPEPGVVQFLLEQLRHDNY